MQLFTSIKQELLERIDNSNQSLKIAVTWFTNKELFNAIIKKLEVPNFKVELIVLNDRINNKREGVDFQKLVDLEGDFYYSEIEDMVHHKFCIIDDETVVTGSYNWTYYAENRNWENVVILDNPKIVNGYISEFEKITSHFSKIKKVSEHQKQTLSINSNEYLETDYLFQAKRECDNGNELEAAKIYTEILKINKKNSAIVTAQKEIVSKYNQQEFLVCPFEIGISFKSGYSMAIPAFEKLPITITRPGLTTIVNQTSVHITIQKFHTYPITIATLDLMNIQPSPESTLKVQHQLTLDKNGFLTIVCSEVGGYGRRVTKIVDIKNWL